MKKYIWPLLLFLLQFHEICGISNNNEEVQGMYKDKVENDRNFLEIPTLLSCEQWSTEAGKIPKYRSFGILTEPNNTEPNLIVYENIGSPWFSYFIAFLCDNFFKFVIFKWLFLA